MAPLTITDPAEFIVTDAEGLQEVCNSLRAAGIFGFDTEFIRERSYTPQVCLIQAATPDTVALIDPLAIDPTPFWELVVDPGLCKIVHAGGQDLEMCYLQTGQAAANIFDVQVAAGLVGLPYPLSYGKLVQAVLKVDVVQGETYSEWAQRPLSPEQLRYAVDDVLHLPAIVDVLAGRLAKLGRETWLRQEMAPLESVDAYAADSEDIWRRVRGWKGLDRRRLSILRELAQWREAAAIKADLPPRSLLRDEVLTTVARKQPRTIDDLAAVRGFPRPLAKREGGAILDAISKGGRTPTSARPEPAERVEDDEVARMLTDLTLAAGQSLCMAGEVNAKLVAARNDYAELVRFVRANSTDAPVPRLLEGWRAEFAGQTLAEMLRGDRSIRVADYARRARLKIK